jgi:hypothetical protein
MNGNEMPTRDRSHGGKAFLTFMIVVLAIIGAAAILPAFAAVIWGLLHLVGGVVAAIFAVILGLIGAAIEVVAAIFASLFAAGAVVFVVGAILLPLIVVVALFVGIGILIGRGHQHG